MCVMKKCVQIVPQKMLTTIVLTQYLVHDLVMVNFYEKDISAVLLASADLNFGCAVAGLSYT